MPLQNRVTPFSKIERSPARGLFTGNRGVLHNAEQELVTTTWRHRAWILCELEYKGWKRKLMQPNRWTELFFLDEATAFAAGHRPCGLCRREAYRRFLNLAGGFATAKALDAALHLERIQPQALLPYGELVPASFFALGANAYLKLPKLALEWTHEGYRRAGPFPDSLQVQPLTPLITRRVLARGYQPLLHPSALSFSA
ncbi:hypothetical protein [Bryobacter aggregatus]|uniref:hypothetical protein n=1 Tax=Bryobacter aggregatus TaxID=360054 RepID=UPI0004E2161E|nr:hypothetical protein [Bryobacter aggregatus]